MAVSGSDNEAEDEAEDGGDDQETSKNQGAGAGEDSSSSSSSSSDSRPPSVIARGPAPSVSPAPVLDPEDGDGPEAAETQGEGEEEHDGATEPGDADVHEQDVSGLPSYEEATAAAAKQPTPADAIKDEAVAAAATGGGNGGGADASRPPRLSDAAAAPNRTRRRVLSQSAELPFSAISTGNDLRSTARLASSSGDFTSAFSSSPTRKSTHPLAVSEQSIAGAGKPKRSLQEERHALRLRERAQKTTDAVNKMRERLAAMGIVPKANPAEEKAKTEEKTEEREEGEAKAEETLPAEETRAEETPAAQKNGGTEEGHQAEAKETAAETQEESAAPSPTKSSSPVRGNNTVRTAGDGAARAAGSAPRPGGVLLESVAGELGAPKPSPLSPSRPNRSGGFGGSGRAQATVLQSLSRPIGDYRQSLQDLQAAMDRVLSMYQECNQAHTHLSQSFAAASSTDPSQNRRGGPQNSAWQQNVMQGATQAQELNAVSGVLSDLKTGLVRVSSQIQSVLPVVDTRTESTVAVDGYPDTTGSLAASWASLPGGGAGVPPPTAMLEQYSELLVGMVEKRLEMRQSSSATQDGRVNNN